MSSFKCRICSSSVHNKAVSIVLQVDKLSLKISGSIPAWLHGDYIRNGPGTFKGMKHLFDGYGMLVKFSFKDGNVTTQQRQALLTRAHEPCNFCCCTLDCMHSHLA